MLAYAIAVAWACSTFGRLTRLTDFVSHVGKHTPQPRHLSSSTIANSSTVMASTGQRSAQILQALQVSSSILAMNSEGRIIFSPVSLKPTKNTQQSAQQLQMNQLGS